MEDALERRALLLHLGRVMQLIVRLDEMAPSAATIGELIARYPILADEPPLAQLRPDMPVDAFRTRALHAFCRWPQGLLDDPLDRVALAASVRASLFSDHPRGWRAYVVGLRRDVAWFDAKATKRRSPRRVADVAPPLPDDGPAGIRCAGRPRHRDGHRARLRRRGSFDRKRGRGETAR
ncbi:hypothetical protein [Paraburkholderia youngii]|uniref:hypothetical protein n=1 Tax=Paraburkholderia youngii TaxID=2782701 RepID=UPI003D1F6261